MGRAFIGEKDLSTKVPSLDARTSSSTTLTSWDHQLIGDAAKLGTETKVVLQGKRNGAEGSDDEANEDAGVDEGSEEEDDENKDEYLPPAEDEPHLMHPPESSVIGKRFVNIVEEAEIMPDVDEMEELCQAMDAGSSWPPHVPSDPGPNGSSQDHDLFVASLAVSQARENAYCVLSYSSYYPSTVKLDPALSEPEMVAPLDVPDSDTLQTPERNTSANMSHGVNHVPKDRHRSCLSILSSQSSGSSRTPASSVFVPDAAPLGGRQLYMETYYPPNFDMPLGNRRD
jgi:hypothetical protein